MKSVLLAIGLFFTTNVYATMRLDCTNPTPWIRDGAYYLRMEDENTINVISGLPMIMQFDAWKVTHSKFLSDGRQAFVYKNLRGATAVLTMQRNFEPGMGIYVELRINSLNSNDYRMFCKVTDEGDRN